MTDTPAITLALTALATVLFALLCVLTVIARRLDRRQMADQAEVERRWPMLAVEDYTEDGELAPQDAVPTLRESVFPLTARPHTECFNAWVDCEPICERCQTILGVRT